MPSFIDLHVDISEVMKSAERMKKAFSAENATRILHDTNVDTARKVKTMVARVASGDYHVGYGWALKGVGAWKSSGAYGAIIPLRSARGVIGPTFPFDGAGHVTGAKRKDGKMDRRRRVKGAKIRRGQTSILPDLHPHQGGHPIFPVNGVALTRSASGKLVRVVGRSLPHMIVNSPSRPKAEKAIEEHMANRLDYHIARCLKNWA